jgi:hypothetical protein
MTYYSPSALLTRISDTLYANNLGEIDATELKQLMTDFLDSLQPRASASGDGVSVMPYDILKSDLDENNEIVIAHHLDTLKPVCFLFDNEGNQLFEIHFTANPENVNSVRLKIEDVMPEGLAYSLLIIKFYGDTDAEPLYKLYFEEPFSYWEGSGWDTNPVDWTFDNSGTVGEFNRVYNDGGAAHFLCTLGSAVNQFLQSDKAMSPGTNYRVVINYSTPSGAPDQLFLFGVENGDTHAKDMRSAILPASTDGNEAIYEFTVPIDWSNSFFEYGFVAEAARDINILVDTITVEII